MIQVNPANSGAINLGSVRSSNPLRSLPSAKQSTLARFVAARSMLEALASASKHVPRCDIDTGDTTWILYVKCKCNLAQPEITEVHLVHCPMFKDDDVSVFLPFTALQLFRLFCTSVHQCVNDSCVRNVPWFGVFRSRYAALEEHAFHRKPNFRWECHSFHDVARLWLHFRIWSVDRYAAHLVSVLKSILACLARYLLTFREQGV